jgi:hypothetical protein
MKSSHSFRRFAFAYAPAFAVLYALALARDLAMVTVYPTLGVFVMGTQHSQDAAPSMGGVPAMYWYGWTATAAVGALILSIIAVFFPERWTPRISLMWLWMLPASAMIACIYLTLPWFRL